MHPVLKRPNDEYLKVYSKISCFVLYNWTFFISGVIWSSLVLNLLDIAEQKHEASFQFTTKFCSKCKMVLNILKQRFPTWGTHTPVVRKKSEGVRQKFKDVNENAIKWPLSYYFGIREFSCSCSGVLEQKKVGNHSSSDCS